MIASLVSLVLAGFVPVPDSGSPSVLLIVAVVATAALARFLKK